MQQLLSVCHSNSRSSCICSHVTSCFTECTSAAWLGVGVLSQRIGLSACWTHSGKAASYML